MTPEAQAALAALELLLKLAPVLYEAIHGTATPAEVLAQARAVLPARGSARKAVDAIFVSVSLKHPRASMHLVDVTSRLAASDVMTREERQALVEVAAIVSDVVTAEAMRDAEALMAPAGAWHEPSGERG